MEDLTLLYVTANKLEEGSAKKIRDYLLEVTENKYPVVSVSQKPIDFGKNICVGDIGCSKFNEYKQILLGVKEVKTKYVACVDDDTLYSPDHFLSRPPKGTFSYETNYWFAQTGKDYYWRVHEYKRKGGGMWGCIAETETLLNNLTRRFEVYPTDPLNANHSRSSVQWGEPGIHDEQIGLPDYHVRVSSNNPCVVFVHPESMGYNQLRRFYRRYGQPLPEDQTPYLEQFGNIEDLFVKYFGGK